MPHFLQPQNSVKFIIMAALAVSLSACGLFKNKEPEKTVCPEHLIIKNASEQEIEDKGNKDQKWWSAINALASECTRKPDSKDVAMVLSTRLLMTRPNNVSEPRVPFHYFIAIMDADNQVLNRQDMTIKPEFKSSADANWVGIDIVDIVLPNSSDHLGDYKIYLGFLPPPAPPEEPKVEVPEIKPEPTPAPEPEKPAPKVKKKKAKKKPAADKPAAEKPVAEKPAAEKPPVKKKWKPLVEGAPAMKPIAPSAPVATPEPTPAPAPSASPSPGEPPLAPAPETKAPESAPATPETKVAP